MTGSSRVFYSWVDTIIFFKPCDTRIELDVRYAILALQDVKTKLKLQIIFIKNNESRYIENSMDQLGPVSVNKITNEPSSRQSILQNFESYVFL